MLVFFQITARYWRVYFQDGMSELLIGRLHDIDGKIAFVADEGVDFALSQDDLLALLSQIRLVEKENPS